MIQFPSGAPNEKKFLSSFSCFVESSEIYSPGESVSDPYRTIVPRSIWTKYLRLR